MTSGCTLKFVKKAAITFLTTMLISACSFTCEVSSKPSNVDAGVTAGQSAQVQASTAQTTTSTNCPSGMILVEGEYCPDVKQECVRWLDKDQSPSANSGIGPMRCAEFKYPTECLSKKREHKRFCIDRFEFPNQEGAMPLVTIDWYHAQATCQSIGKRLCTAKEWTFACEGEDMRPYPYDDGQGGHVGYYRDEGVCDQFHDSMDPSKQRSEWSKYNYSHASGSYQQCKSQFGVYDMTANVDEWVLNEGGRSDGDPYFSGLKGGYWTWKVRTRCRPMTTVHGPGHSFYQQGLRCCSDAK